MLTTTLSSSFLPSGTESSEMFGILNKKLSILSKIILSSLSFSFSSRVFLSIVSFNESVLSPADLSFPNSEESLFLSA